MDRRDFVAQRRRCFFYAAEVGRPITWENYRGLWIAREFHRNFVNTVLVTLGTVSISLTVGCLAGYALSRYRGSLGFWL